MKKLLLVVLAFLSSSAYSGTIICSGKVSQLSYHSPDTFMIRLDSMNKLVFFCNTENQFTPSGTSYTTGTETCKTLYSTFLAAKLSGKSISSMYFDGDDVPSSCSGWGNFKNANIRHFIFAE